MDAKKTGELIATLRHEQRLKQNELAELLGVTNKAISRWETGRGYPDIETLPKLAEVLNISIPELLRGERFQPSANLRSQQKPIHSQAHCKYDDSMETVCQYAGALNKKQKKKVVLLMVLLSVLIFVSAFFFFCTEVLPVIGQLYYSIVGSSDCVIARDYRSLTYLNHTYVPLPMNGYSCVIGERMVAECRVEGAGFVEKLFFGEMLYELQNIPDHELVYLQTEYDRCISRYFVLESEYERYSQMLRNADFGCYYSSHYNESGYTWEKELSSSLVTLLQDPNNSQFSQVSDSIGRIEILLFDEHHRFYFEAGTLLQTADGYYWCPSELPFHGYGMHEGCTWTKQYYLLTGLDHELSALFSH